LAEDRPSGQRRLIVNADDFGQSEGINEGVVQAHDAGVVTSASLMVRWPAAVAAAAAARERPRLSVGLHLDLGEWVYRDGMWEPLYEVVATADEGAVRREVEHQLQRFEELMGEPPTHLDSHQHVHRSEPVRTVMLDVAASLGVPLRHFAPDIRYSGEFYGQSGRGEAMPEMISVEALQAVLDGLPPGITELGCHPAGSADAPSPYRLERVAELRTLRDERIDASIAAHQITQSSFRDVGDADPDQCDPVAQVQDARRRKRRGGLRERADLFTIVVATYGRPDALRCALETVQLQDEKRWQVLVIGDHADEQTAAVVPELQDGRMRFVNLPARQGEQSLPNSVGMLLADTPYVSFLNQDDLWLPDHLSRSLNALRGGRADFYAGSAAFARDCRERPGSGLRPVFSERAPVERSLEDAFSSAYFLFEPASAWVMSRVLARKVGPWRPASDLDRTPLEDWVLRSWRARARFHQDREVGVLKLNTHALGEVGRLYARTADDHRVLLDLIRARGSQGMRALIASDIAVAKAIGLPPRRDTRPRFVGPWGVLRRDSERAPEWEERLRDPRAVRQYLTDGTDVFEEISREAGLEKGHALRAALWKRTGERLGEPWPLADLVADAERQLEDR
jgi:chitin disaccharide deacetylase